MIADWVGPTAAMRPDLHTVTACQRLARLNPVVHVQAAADGPKGSQPAPNSRNEEVLCLIVNPTQTSTQYISH